LAEDSSRVPKPHSFIRYWLPVLIWMAVIFSASSDSGSFRHSSHIIAPLIHWFFPSISDATVHSIVVFVRKCAHLTEFAVLALLLWRALYKPVRREPRPWSRRIAWQTLLLVLLYASSDEFHQLFVPSRQASVVDVMIDTTGAACGLLLLWALGKWLG
jgi:VanZ family protein